MSAGHCQAMSYVRRSLSVRRLPASPPGAYDVIGSLNSLQLMIGMIVACIRILVNQQLVYANDWVCKLMHSLSLTFSVESS